jgi:protein-tyrosine-phosphatase
MNILFVCRYNRFRSRIAESYFKKINKNKDIHVKSAGVIRGSYPLDKREVAAAKSLGIKLAGKPIGLSTDLMKEVDLIIIVADNIPRNMLNFNGYTGKVIVWRIKDIVNGESKALIEKRIKKIMKKVERIVRKMEEPTMVK